MSTEETRRIYLARIDAIVCEYRKCENGMEEVKQVLAEWNAYEEIQRVMRNTEVL